MCGWCIIGYAGVIIILLTLANICWHLLTYADICWQLLTFADICWHLLIVADICWQLLTRKNFSSTKFYGYDDICWRLLTFADIYWHLLTLADVCWHLLTFADIRWSLPARTMQQFSKNALVTPAGHWLARTSLGYRISVPKRAWAGPSRVVVYVLACLSVIRKGCAIFISHHGIPGMKKPYFLKMNSWV